VVKQLLTESANADDTINANAPPMAMDLNDGLEKNFMRLYP
jgi:hypothetical protein